VGRSGSMREDGISSPGRAPRHPAEAGGTAARAWRWGSAALALALPWLIWRRMLGLELLGWDAYPLVAASRVEGVRDALGELAEPLMDGRYPLGLYWRPLVHLSFALDRALWGLDATGYHATDLALLSINACLVGALARRWIGGAGAAASASLLLAAHLVHVDVLWAPARRADALALAFTLAALLAASSSERRAALRRSLVAIFCVAALMSKETGAVALAAVAWQQLVVAPPGRRVSSVIREIGPAAVAFAAAFAARAAVLGGLGGATSAAVDLSSRLRAFAAYLPSALAPASVRAISESALVSGTIGLALLATAIVLALRKPASGSAAPSKGSLLVVLLGWYVALAAVTALAGADRGWYELPFVAIHALFLVALLDLVARIAPRLGPAIVVAGAVAASLPGLWTALDPRRFVPPELGQASEAERDLLRQVDRALATLAPSSTVELGPVPLELRCAEPGLDGRPRTIAALAPYSADAYVELVDPELARGGTKASLSRSGRLVVARP
jgi:hypothetical protein